MIAILMTTYNGEKYILEQLDSISKQTVQEWKLFINDDCSTDKTVPIINNYIKENHFEGKIILNVNGSKQGSPKANFLNSLKKIPNEFDFYMFADQDDFWCNDKISICLKEANNNHNNVLIHTDLLIANSNLEQVSSSFVKFSNLNNFAQRTEELCVLNNVTGCTVLFNNEIKRILDNLNEENENQILMHDQFAAIIASELGQIKYINKPTILYRQHDNNSVGAKSREINLKALKGILKDTRKKVDLIYNQANCAKNLLNSLGIDSKNLDIFLNTGKKSFPFRFVFYCIRFFDRKYSLKYRIKFFVFIIHKNKGGL